MCRRKGGDRRSVLGISERSHTFWRDRCADQCGDGALPSSGRDSGCGYGCKQGKWFPALCCAFYAGVWSGPDSCGNLPGIDLWDVPLCLSGPSGNDVMAGPWRKQETDEGKPDPSGDAADQFYRLGTYFHIDSGNWSFVVKWLYSLYDRMVL